MRTYKRKTDRGKTPVGVYERASEEVLQNGRSLRNVADEYGINFMTLGRYCKKKREARKSIPTAFYLFYKIVLN